MRERDIRSIRIDLVYDPGCPHVELARATTQAAIRETGTGTTYSEWDRGQRRTPARFRPYGSPTVLVNGKDVCAEDGGADTTAQCCRLYRGADGRFAGTPSIELIVRAIREAAGKSVDAPETQSDRPSTLQG